MKYPRQLLTELQKQGFKRTDTFRSIYPAGCVVTYQKTVNDRKLDLQLWGDGNHRVTHWHSFLGNPLSIKDTPPTEFETLEQMREAIQTELTRTDYPKQE